MRWSFQTVFIIFNGREGYILEILPREMYRFMEFPSTAKLFIQKKLQNNFISEAFHK